MAEPAGKLDRRRVRGCACSSFAYILPKRLDESALPFLEPLGRLTVPFSRLRVLNLECGSFTVTGIKKMKEIRIRLADHATEEDLERFEKALLSWLAS